jgi:three-Cys-motif partner protein
MSIQETLWDLQPHTLAKHEILRRYLEAWFPILSSFNKRIVYIDGFAGPGEYAGGEPGSPVIAMETALGHSRQLADEVVMLFIEERADRFQHLQGLVNSRQLPSWLTVEVHHGRFDEQMIAILDYIEDQGASIAPTFAFIDPFGYSHTPMSLVSRLMANPKCEALITFVYESVNRFVTWDNQENQAHLDGLFGTPEWRSVGGLDDPLDRRTFLHDLYVKQLRDMAAISFVRSFQMINDGNRTEYFLFFGTNGFPGLKKMKYAMWGADPIRGVQFSDATDQTQTLLFEAEPDFEQLRRLLLDWGAGTERSVEEIETYVVEETPFAHTHYKRVLKDFEKEGTVEIVRSSRQRRWAYPKGTVLRFTDS